MTRILTKIMLLVIGFQSVTLMAGEVTLYPPSNSPPVDSSCSILDSTSINVVGTAQSGTITITRIKSPTVSVQINTVAGENAGAIAIKLQDALRGKIGQSIVANGQKLALTNISNGMIAVRNTDSGLNFAPHVTNATATSDPNGVSIQWTKPSSVASVRIWRGDILLVCTQNVIYTDLVGRLDQNKPIVYKIVSFDAAGNPGDMITINYPN